MFASTAGGGAMALNFQPQVTHKPDRVITRETPPVPAGRLRRPATQTLPDKAAA